MSQSSRRFCSRKISGWFSMRFANIITQRLMTSLDFSGAAIAFPTRSETTGQKYCRQDLVKPLDCLPSRQICSQDRAGGVVTHSSIPPSTLSWMICAAVCLITSRSSKTRNVPRRARKLLFVRNAAMNSGLMEHVERMLRRHKSTSLRTRLWWADASGRVAKSPTKVSSRDASRSRAADTGKKRSAYRR